MCSIDDPIKVLQEYHGQAHIYAILCAQTSVSLHRYKNTALVVCLILMFACAVLDASALGTLYADECLYLSAVVLIVCWMLLLTLVVMRTVEKATHYHLLACRMQRLASNIENDLANHRDTIDHMHVFCTLRLYHELVDSVVCLLPDTMLHGLVQQLRHVTVQQKPIEVNLPVYHAKNEVCSTLTRQEDETTVPELEGTPLSSPPQRPSRREQAITRPPASSPL